MTELDQRFEQIGLMLDSKNPTRRAEPIVLTVDASALSTLSHFEKGAIAAMKAQVDRMESLTRAMCRTVADIRGFDLEIEPVSLQSSRVTRFALDPDRLEGAFRIMATLWIAFLIFVFFPGLPGGQGFVSLAATFAGVIAQTPTARASSMLPPFALGGLCAGVLYVFVMPHLSGYAALGSMIFLVTFVMYYVFGKPQQAMAKLAGIVSFISLVSIQNEQTYSFAGYANGFANLMMVILLAAATQYIPYSPRPEKRFLRLLARFFRNSEFLIARLSPDWRAQRGLTDWWKTFHYSAESRRIAPPDKDLEPTHRLSELPRKQA